MGKPILIYHDGQRYEIDSDLIYIPRFISGLSNPTMHSIGMMSKLEIRIEEKDENTKGNSDQN